MIDEIKSKILAAVMSFSADGNSPENAADMLIRQLTCNAIPVKMSFSPSEFFEYHDDASIYNEIREKQRSDFCAKVKSISIISQMIESEVSQFLLQKKTTNQHNNMCLFLFVQTHKAQYRNVDYKRMTRLLNRHFHMSIVVIYYCEKKLSLAFIRRFPNKALLNSQNIQHLHHKDRLGRLCLVAGVDCECPHGAHIEILSQFSMWMIKDKLIDENNLFVNLYSHWETVLDSNKLRYLLLIHSIQSIFDYVYTNGYISNSIIRDFLSDAIPDHNSDKALRAITSTLKSYNVSVYDLISCDFYEELKKEPVLLNQEPVLFLNYMEDLSNFMEQAISFFDNSNHVTTNESRYYKEVRQYRFSPFREDVNLGQITSSSFFWKYDSDVNSNPDDNDSRKNQQLNLEFKSKGTTDNSSIENQHNIDQLDLDLDFND